MKSSETRARLLGSVCGTRVPANEIVLFPGAYTVPSQIFVVEDAYTTYNFSVVTPSASKRYPLVRKIKDNSTQIKRERTREKNKMSQMLGRAREGLPWVENLVLGNKFDSPSWVVRG